MVAQGGGALGQQDGRAALVRDDRRQHGGGARWRGNQRGFAGQRLVQTMVAVMRTGRGIESLFRPALAEVFLRPGAKILGAENLVHQIHIKPAMSHIGAIGKKPPPE